ncbi:hypothetical protein TNCV_2512591 [Trichonephila clavipes]|nr:hypothetical protein TNCV_2512591 [Trichonephila clavipes]
MVLRGYLAPVGTICDNRSRNDTPREKLEEGHFSFVLERLEMRMEFPRVSKFPIRNLQFDPDLGDSHGALCAVADLPAFDKAASSMKVA